MTSNPSFGFFPVHVGFYVALNTRSLQISYHLPRLSPLSQKYVPLRTCISKFIFQIFKENDEDIDEDDRYDDFDPRKPASPAGPAFDPTQFKDDPIALMKLAKKGKVLMMFATVAGSPSKKDTEQITARWQTSLFNAQIQVERYMLQ